MHVDFPVAWRHLSSHPHISAPPASIALPFSPKDALYDTAACPHISLKCAPFPLSYAGASTPRRFLAATVFVVRYCEAHNSAATHPLDSVVFSVQSRDHCQHSSENATRRLSQGRPDGRSEQGSTTVRENSLLPCLDAWCGLPPHPFQLGFVWICCLPYTVCRIRLTACRIPHTV